MSKKYDERIQKHKEYVTIAFNWLKTNLPDIFDDTVWKNTEYSCIYGHDISKMNKDEYDAFDEYLYNKNKSLEITTNYYNALLLHIHRNPHHWQYWILYTDDYNKEIILDMPDCYILEMICDWWSFSWEKNRLHEIFKWYERKKKYIKLSDNTRKKVEMILNSMQQKLDELLKGTAYEDIVFI